jgi:hypothetical protein
MCLQNACASQAAGALQERWPATAAARDSSKPRQKKRRAAEPPAPPFLAGKDELAMRTLLIDANLTPPAGLRRIRDAARQGHFGRSQRVAAVLAVALVLSLFDLAVTMQQMSTTGMFEGNPLVRFVVNITGSVAPLIALKALSLLVSISLIMRLRHHWQAEVGAWLSLGTLIMLTVVWGMYLSLMSDLAAASPDELRMYGGFVVINDR